MDNLQIVEHWGFYFILFLLDNFHLKVNKFKYLFYILGANDAELCKNIRLSKIKFPEFVKQPARELISNIL